MELAYDLGKANIIFPFDVITLDPYWIKGCLEPRTLNVDVFRFPIFNCATVLLVDKLLNRVWVVITAPIAVEKDDNAFVTSTILALEIDDIVENICVIFTTGPKTLEKLEIVENNCGNVTRGPWIVEKLDILDWSSLKRTVWPMAVEKLEMVE